MSYTANCASLEEAVEDLQIRNAQLRERVAELENVIGRQTTDMQEAHTAALDLVQILERP